MTRGQLKISDERAAFEYDVRSGGFVKVDKDQIDQEQNRRHPVRWSRNQQKGQGQCRIRSAI
jgi:hypothetical protein